MKNESLLSIGEVVKRTGLSERSLRYYEQFGLITPARTEAGRRVYGAGDLTTLHHITILKRAGFPLKRIRELFARPDFDGGAIIAAQIMALEAERSAIDTAIDALHAARKAGSRGRTIGVEALCNLIQIGERKMQEEAWKQFIGKHYTPEEIDQWKAAKEQAVGGDFEGYKAKMGDLFRRIEAALPMDPASSKAQAFLAEWNALLKPFAEAIPAHMKAKNAAVERMAQSELPKGLINRPAMEFYRAAREAAKK
jgi:DNA-binding transcriptional MerR regulator